MARWREVLGYNRADEALLLDALEAVGVTVEQDGTAIGCIGFVLGNYTHEKLQAAMTLSRYVPQGADLFPCKGGEMFVEYDRGVYGYVYAVVTSGEASAGDKYIEFSGY